MIARRYEGYVGKDLEAPDREGPSLAWLKVPHYREGERGRGPEPRRYPQELPRLPRPANESLASARPRKMGKRYVHKVKKPSRFPQTSCQSRGR